MRSFDFNSVASLVLEGACAVETVPDVPAWPKGDARPAGVVQVLMHRALPGAVCLLGHFKTSVFLVGCFSSRLREVLQADWPTDFVFSSDFIPERDVHFLCRAVSAACRSADETALDDFLYVCGAEGAELISELLRLQRLSLSDSEALH